MLASLAILGLLVAQGGAPVPPPDDPGTDIELRLPEVRLLDGTFRLRLNSGWFRTAPTMEPLARRNFDMDGALDIRDRSGRLKLAGGNERSLMLRIVWDVRQDSDMARVHSQIDVALLGHTFTLSPPDVRLRPRFDNGMPGVEVNVPLLEGSF